MKWSLKIGQVRGIGIFVHASFLILVAIVGIYFYAQTKDLFSVLDGIVYIIILFAIVVIHELSHALTAKKFGVQTKDIILLPIGGVSRMERIPDKPWQELLVAVAGPMVNILFAVLIYVGFFVFKVSINWNDVEELNNHFFVRLFIINVMLAVFNLLPAFPMDGGRILRAALALRMEYVRATQIAATVGQIFAVVFGIVGLLYNPILVFIAIFVWFGAAQEATLSKFKSALQGIPVSAAMVTQFEILNPQDSLEEAMNHTVAGFQQDFPVEQDGQLIGILTRNDLLKALQQSDKTMPISQFIRHDFEVAHPQDLLETVFNRLSQLKIMSIPVVQNGHIVGLISFEHLWEYLMIKSVIKRKS